MKSAKVLGAYRDHIVRNPGMFKYRDTDTNELLPKNPTGLVEFFSKREVPKDLWDFHWQLEVVRAELSIKVQHEEIWCSKLLAYVADKITATRARIDHRKQNVFKDDRIRIIPGFGKRYRIINAQYIKPGIYTLPGLYKMLDSVLGTDLLPEEKRLFSTWNNLWHELVDCIEAVTEHQYPDQTPHPNKHSGVTWEIWDADDFCKCDVPDYNRYNANFDRDC